MKSRHVSIKRTRRREETGWAYSMGMLDGRSWFAFFLVCGVAFFAFVSMDDVLLCVLY